MKLNTFFLFQEMFGHSINFKELNFDSLESFLLFLNGVMLHMRYVKGRIMLYPQIEEQEPKTDTPLPPITEVRIQSLLCCNLI